VNDNLGGNTEDLLTLRQALPTETHLPPDDHEQAFRRFGRRNYIAGISLCVLFALISLTLALVTDHHAFTSQDGRMFAVLALVAFIALAAVLTAIGAMERLNRHQRAATRRVAAEASRNRELIERLEVDLRERDEYIIGLVAPTPGRLAMVEQRLSPVEAAISSLAVHLPDTLQREHWMGFNDAVREGFTGQQTGTDGASARRARHLGLAPTEPTDN
jgi:hypothetical protein